MNPIEKNAFHILNFMIESNKESLDRNDLQNLCGLSLLEITDALDYLESIGAIKGLKFVSQRTGHERIEYVTVNLLSRGRYLYYEIKAKEEAKEKEGQIPNVSLPTRPLNPIGSPYGFTKYDWETVTVKKEDGKTLEVVVGLQFKSTFYNTEHLVDNLNFLFSESIEEYNRLYDRNKISLNIEQLGAGYGEHLFNDIARSIIGADIAVFESSDLNSNVMLEMGVALTWGIKVLPIRKRGCQKPPSDISGQTWIEYNDNLLTIFDNNFHRRLLKMIERTMDHKRKINEQFVS